MAAYKGDKRNKKVDEPVIAWYRMHPNEKMSPKSVYLQKEKRSTK
jgi:hypothetical protein